MCVRARAFTLAKIKCQSQWWLCFCCSCCGCCSPLLLLCLLSARVCVCVLPRPSLALDMGVWMCVVFFSLAKQVRASWREHLLKVLVCTVCLWMSKAHYAQTEVSFSLVTCRTNGSAKKLTAKAKIIPQKRHDSCEQMHALRFYYSMKNEWLKWIKSKCGVWRCIWLEMIQFGLEPLVEVEL